jgi:hypothetical protein
MGLDITIPIIVIVLLMPLGVFWAKRYFKDGVDVREADVFVAPSDRLTSRSLRELESPPWRIVYEIPHGKLNGIAHVLIGPAGVFALRTTMDPMPAPTRDEPDARAIGQSAIARGAVDDALRRCAMSTDRLVFVHWGVNEGSEIATEVMPAVTAVDGRELHTWAKGLRNESLTASQVDLAWQTIVTAIGRPDPLR